MPRGKSLNKFEIGKIIAYNGKGCRKKNKLRANWAGAVSSFKIFWQILMLMELNK